MEEELINGALVTRCARRRQAFASKAFVGARLAAVRARIFDEAILKVVDMLLCDFRLEDRVKDFPDD